MDMQTASHERRGAIGRPMRCETMVVLVQPVSPRAQRHAIQHPCTNAQDMRWRIGEASHSTAAPQAACRHPVRVHANVGCSIERLWLRLRFQLSLALSLLVSLDGPVGFA